MNWGNRILIVFIVFAMGIAYLVYRTTQTNFDLVESDYYKKELSFQQQIDRTNEANSLSAQVTVIQNEEGIQLQLPPEMKDKRISGNVWFYCAYDKNRDKRFRLETDSNLIQLFAAGTVLPGNYTVKIDWNDNQKYYYSEKLVTLQ
jgi:hypothetical protein